MSTPKKTVPVKTVTKKEPNTSFYVGMKGTAKPVVKALDKVLKDTQTKMVKHIEKAKEPVKVTPVSPAFMKDKLITTEVGKKIIKSIEANANRQANKVVKAAIVEVVKAAVTAKPEAVVPPVKLVPKSSIEKRVVNLFKSIPGVTVTSVKPTPKPIVTLVKKPVPKAKPVQMSKVNLMSTTNVLKGMQESIANISK